VVAGRVELAGAVVVFLGAVEMVIVGMARSFSQSGFLGDGTEDAKCLP